MGDLLNEIQILSPKAADVLKQEGFETDSDIQSLTREDLHELLPGAGDFKLRKNVFEMIHKSRPPNMPQKELGELLNNLASSAHIDPGVLMDHNRFIDEQLLIVQLLLDDTKDLQKKIYTGQPDSKAVKGAVMGDLLKEIQIMSPEAADALTSAVMGDLLKEIQLMSPKAADVLKQAGFQTDSDIWSLTREDLHNLLPGVEDLKLRKDVFEMIQKSRSPNMPLKELGELQNNLASCAFMRDLLKEIQLKSKEAADVLKKAGFRTDSDIQSLTREDLHDLLPGRKDLRLRKNVFETIHKSRLN